MSETTPTTHQQSLQVSQEALNQALTIAKIYIDQSAANNKQYFQNLLDDRMNTTDLTAKLELLNQINNILDGDEASEGFQAWQASLNQLNDLASRVTTNEQETATLKGQYQTVTANLTTLSSTLSQRITDEVAVLNKTITDKDAATNKRIDDLETARDLEKIAQVEKDANQSGAIGQVDAKVDSAIESIETEAQARVEADAAQKKRITANEQAISDLNALQGNYVTHEQATALFTGMVGVAESVFGLKADGTPAAGAADSV